MKSYTVYTDGSCLKNPGGPGGHACIIIDNDNDKIITKQAFGEHITTNNRMELKAAILGLSYFKSKTEVTIITDSTYVRNGFEEGWIQKWIKDNWKNSRNKPVKNRDLWEKLIKLVNFHNVTFKWVKGHSENEFNNMVDIMARDSAIDAGLNK